LEARRIAEEIGDTETIIGTYVNRIDIVGL
jgi:hypothetical protein